MKKVISFGDSFTVGLGTDIHYEESQLGSHPDWDTMTDKEKHLKRKEVNIFRNENSFTKYFCDYFPDSEWKNNGRIGCSNIDILNTIFEMDLKHPNNEAYEDFFYLIQWSSSLRDSLPWFPQIYNDSRYFGLTTGIKSLTHMLNKGSSIWKGGDPIGGIGDFLSQYLPKYLVESYTEDYYKIYNGSILHLLIDFLNFRKVKYIIMDGFETMINDNKFLDTKYYWGYGDKTIHSYLKTFKDESLFEDKKEEFDCKHPSKKGHKLFAEELFRFYNEVY